MTSKEDLISQEYKKYNLKVTYLVVIDHGLLRTLGSAEHNSVNTSSPGAQISVALLLMVTVILYS